MKAFRLILFAAALSMVFLQNCKNDGENDGNSPQSIVGKWSIVLKDYLIKDAGGSILEDETFTYPANEFTFEFKSDGTFIYINIVDGDWFTGTYNYNSETGEITINVLGSSLSGNVQDLTSSTITVFITDTYTDDNGTFTEENTFSGSINGPTVPTFTLEEIQAKWSIEDLQINTYVDVNDDDDYNPATELYQSLSFADIPHNRNTIEFMSNGKALNIDSYMESDWEEQDWVMVDGSNLIIDDGSDEQLVHLESRTGNTFLFRFFSYSFEQIADSYYNVKTEGAVTVVKNDGSEPMITNEDFFTSWEITDFIEYKNGVEDPGSEGAPIGAIITFNTNGTGSLVAGTDNFTLVDVKLVDDSNFYFEFDSGDEYNQVLLNVQSFNSGTGKLEVVEGEIREEYDPELMEDVLVQRESHISLSRQ